MRFLPTRHSVVSVSSTRRRRILFFSGKYRGGAVYLQSWQQAQEAKLKHLQFQLTTVQMEVVEEVMARLLPRARESQGDSPNARGTALYLLCIAHLEREESSP